jgi:hypothetical protein
MTSRIGSALPGTSPTTDFSFDFHDLDLVRVK